MKFTSIRLEGVSDIELHLANASISDPYILKSAEGLGPPEVNVFIAQTRNMDGYYKGRQAQYREIVLTIGLNPNYKDNIMVSDLRAELYGLLSAGSSDAMRLVIVNEDTNLMCATGYIKKMEIVPFSVSPEVQLTIASNQSCFQGLSEVYVDMKSGSGVQDVVNQGTAETGFVFQVTFTQNSDHFLLTDARNNIMLIWYPFQVDDILMVDTRPGSRSIRVWTVPTDNQIKNILYALTQNSDWLWLYGGTNTLSFIADIHRWDEFYYTPQYWGV